MTAATTLAERAQTLGEEIANAISHGIGFAFAIASLPILLAFAPARSTTLNIVAACVFSSSMMLLYGVSTLYHAWPSGRFKAWLNRLDHAAIYVFIAGSYTPFVLGVLRGSWGWSLFATIWTMAVVGVTAKLLNRLQHLLWSTALYVAMGWLAVIAAAPLVARMPGSGLAWLIAGGVAYTLGAVVFMFDSKLRYAHFVWHLFVLGGSTCHFFAVLWHAQ
ncbi:MAG TPA: hemolysin III family protein [Burkholderiaceae bacterium]|nr:hemolysin III family protein [Burkholderiaceae bacterium]